MPDIRKAKGYLAIDDSLHDTLKQATDHTIAVKTKKALEEAFAGISAYGPDVPTQPLQDFLYNNRAVLLVALNQEVLLRKPRGPNKKKATEQPAANDATAGQAAA